MVGSEQRIADRQQQYGEIYGISYYTIPETNMDELAKVVIRLRRPGRPTCRPEGSVLASKGPARKRLARSVRDAGGPRS